MNTLQVGDANALVGFGAGAPCGTPVGESLASVSSGASLISFYIRVGGGIFSKGSDIGAVRVLGFLEPSVLRAAARISWLSKSRGRWTMT